MSASRQEMQDAADRFLETLGVRMTRAGQVVLHFSDGGVFQRVEMNQVIKPGPNARPNGDAARFLTDG